MKSTKKSLRFLSLVALVLCLAMALGMTAFAAEASVAKVDNTEYANIDDAIAAWTSTNNSTLTLLADVTLSDVIKLSSTEYHILDLGTYTMTAASKKDAIQIVNNGRSSASYTLDIKADATNPGGITASGKTVVVTTGKSGVKDRPIIRFYNGVFNGSYIVKHSGSNGINCPQFQFYGGVFNGTISTNRALNQFYGGTFNGSMFMSVDSSAYTLIAGGTFKNLSNSMHSDLDEKLAQGQYKFTIGSAKGVYDKEVYIDDNGNYVIAAAKPAQGIEAAAAQTPGGDDYLYYSKVATEGQLNYTDVEVALEKNNSASAKVTVYVDELDMTGIKYKGTIVVPEGQTLTITNAPAGLKTEGNVNVVVDVASVNDVGYTTLEEAFAAAQAGETIVLLADATPALTSQRAITKAAVIDLNGKTLTLIEDDLYFGTTEFKNGTIVVDPSVKASTAVFWMFENQTLTFDGVKIVATGVTGTYLIGLDGNNSDLNLLNGSEIVVENTTALDLDIICVNASTGNDIVINNSKVNVTNLDGRVFFRGNYTVSGTSEIALSGITKAGFRIEAGQTLSIEDTAKVTIAGEPRDGGIHLTDVTATYTVAETATVTATVNKPAPVVTYVAQIGEQKFESVAAALAYAKEQGMTDVVITLIGENESNTTDSFDLVYTTLFNSVTLKQEDATKTYYLYDLYTGVRTNGGKFIFDGVNITVTDQYMFEGNVELINNSKITSTAEANCFFYYADVVINAGSSIKGVIEDIRGGTLTIDGGKTDGTYTEAPGLQDAILAVNWTDSKLVLKNGAYIKINSANEVGRLTVNGTMEVSNSKVDSYQWIDVTAGATLTVNGNSTIITQKITGAGNLVLDAAGMTAGTVATINADVSGFTGTLEVMNNDGLEAKIVDGKIVLTPVIYVAQIGEQKFESLQAAINAATAGQTITFLADITEDVTIDKAVTIDGADKTYTGKMTLKADTTIKNVNFDGKGYNGYAVETRGANYLTIEGCTAKNYGYGFVQLASATALTTVKDVTVSNMNYGVKVDYSGAVVLENCDITAGVAAVLNSNYGEKTITIKDSKLNILGTWTRNNTIKTTYVFEGANAIDSFITEAAIDNFKLALGATLTAPETIAVTTDVEHAYVKYADGKFIVEMYAAKIGNKYYETLAEAIAEKAKKTASTKDDIILYSDIELNETLEIRGNKTIVIDLNGHTVTSTAKKAFEIYAKTVTIKNGTIKAVQRCVDTREAVTLTLTGVTLIADEYSTHGNPQPLTIGGSTDGTRVTMTNVNISAKAGYGIITFVKTNLTATNSTISGYSALYVKPGSEDSTFNFVGCTLAGSTVGNDVEGNSFSTIAVRAEDVAVTVNKSSTVTATGTYCSAISFGGNYVPEAGPMKGAKVTIAEGATIGGDIVAAAKLGNKYYATLADAIAERDNASSSDKLILMSNIVLKDTLTIEASKAIVLDLNSFTISQEKACTGHYAMIVNNSKSLTIMDSVGGGKISFTDTGAGDPNFGWGSYTIVNEGKMIVNSGIIENLSAQNANGSVKHMYCAIQQNNTKAQLQVNGGTISTPSYRSIRINAGSLTFGAWATTEEGATIEGQVWIQPFADGINVNVNNGKFSPRGVDGSSIYIENRSKTVAFRVNGGEFATKIGCANPDALKGCIRGGSFTETAIANTNAALFHKNFVNK